MNLLLDYDYHLPSELIAQFPPSERTASRLLKVEGDRLIDSQLPDFLSELRQGDVLVLNNTRVIPARVFGAKDTGGKLELLLERITSSDRILAQIKASKAPKIGQSLVFTCDPRAQVRVVGRQGSFFEVELIVDSSLVEWFEKHGHMPLPPYIERDDDKADVERYQTVFAQHSGAVAAPTAGLHFDDELLQEIADKGVEIQEITLHVGAGTYQPVRADKLDSHKMHSEWLEVSAATCEAINTARQQGGKIVAVGTTVVRALETAALNAPSDILQAYTGDTEIFIYPGFEFKVIDKLLTNFHLPQSTLLMLVSALAGRETILSAYQHAIEQQYRFFSYGDAMLLSRQNKG